MVFDQQRVGKERSEEAILLDELQHRVANEVQASVAAMHLVKRAGAGEKRVALLDRALQRMTGFGQVHRVLGERMVGDVDVAAPLRTVCWGLLAGRVGAELAEVKLTLPVTIIEGRLARRILLVAAELVFNSVRHALEGRRGNLSVRIWRDDFNVTLVIGDDGPGMSSMAPTSGTGLGGAIVAELVRGGRGAIDCDTGAGGTTFTVRFPVEESEDAF